MTNTTDKIAATVIIVTMFASGGALADTAKPQKQVLFPTTTTERNLDREPTQATGNSAENGRTDERNPSYPDAMQFPQFGI